MNPQWPWSLPAMILVGCPAVVADSGKAVIQGTTEGPTVSGTATLTDTPEGLKITVRVEGVSAGKHGLHIHEFGVCDDQGKAAGGHYNPDGVKHGFLPTDGFKGAHAGDLGNIEVGGDGTGRLDLTIRGLRVSGGKHAVGGRAVVLHAQVDDVAQQPAGNAGARIGCGPIVITGK